VSCYLHNTALRRGETASVTRLENLVNPSTGLEALVKKGILPLPGVKLKFLSRPAHSLGIRSHPGPPFFCFFFLHGISVHFSPLSGHGLPDLLPPKISLPSCRLPVLYLKVIYGIPPNSLLPSASRLSYVSYSSKTYSNFLYENHPSTTWPARRGLFGRKNVDSAT
jgi:hypothetical protein